MTNLYPFRHHLMTETIHFYSQSLALALLFVFQGNFPIRNVAADGFTIDLIHRDSPASPLYNPHETHSERLMKSFQRCFSPFHLLENYAVKPAKNAFSYVYPDNGEYLLKVSLGTPPVDIYGIVDTGSDLFWTQCRPCAKCYKQINPIFNPAASSSYRKISCRSKSCHLLDTVSCSRKTSGTCNYTYGYGDNSLTKGVLSKETITISSNSGQPVSFTKMVFGCGHENSGTFSEHEMGVIGLGGRPLSLVSQIGSRLGSKKFSHCLVPFHTNPSIRSKMRFGDGSEVTGRGVVSMPLVPLQDQSYYYVTLEGISVGNKFVPFSSSTPMSRGNMFIDSGTPPTIIPQDFYDRLLTEVKLSIRLSPILDDPDLGTQLCYSGRDNTFAPKLIARFEGGAKLQLNPVNTFIPPKDDVFCLAMVPTASPGGIIGNFAQSNFLVGFDLERKVVSFKPTDCTKQN